MKHLYEADNYNSLWQRHQVLVPLQELPDTLDESIQLTLRRPQN